MNSLLAQLILARRSEDAEKWMNILFVVVLAAFWALGGILKARAKKSQGGDARRSPRRPVRQPPAQSRAAREQLLRQAGPPVRQAERRPGLGQARSRLAELRAAAQKFAAEAEQAFRAQVQGPPPQSPPPIQKPTSPRGATDIAVSSAQPPPAPAEQKPPAPEPVSASTNLAELLNSYADPDQLRRAILHYEILGKPLALRDPPDSAAGL